MENLYGLARETMIPVRKEPSETSEMISQLLFGEPFIIFDRQLKWSLIKSTVDDYEGWIDNKMYNKLAFYDFQNIINQDRLIVSDQTINIRKDGDRFSQQVLPGSFIWNYDPIKDNFSLKNTQFSILSKVKFASYEITGEKIIELAYNYINAPYLWGGKTILGVDCSGFTQMVFRQLQLFIARDAGQQAETGETINFIDEIQPGDLAFFDNEEGRIIHVGILIDKHHIIHASGKVRIDKFDQQGIYNKEEGSYSHKLRILKRYF